MERLQSFSFGVVAMCKNSVAQLRHGICVRWHGCTAACSKAVWYPHCLSSFLILDGAGWRGMRWVASQTDVATFSHRFMIQRVKTRHTRRAPTSGNEIPVRVHVVNAACRKSVASDRIRAAALSM